MKMRQPLFTPVTLSFLVAALVWGGTPANAATTTTTTSVSVSGTVSGSSGDSGFGTGDSTSGESVSFSGDVVLKADVVEDPDFKTPPVVLLSLDFSKVTGVGSMSRTKYVTANLTTFQRRLTSGSDAVTFTFPFWPSGTTGITTNRVGGASFSLTFDTRTRKLTGASGSITSP